MALLRAAVGLLAPGETVLKALTRLGKLKGKSRKKKGETPLVNTEAEALAGRNFNQLTEAADALLNAGETDVYDSKKEKLDSKAREIALSDGVAGGWGYFGKEKGALSDSAGRGDDKAVEWQYRGKDGNLHGPFSR